MNYDIEKVTELAELFYSQKDISIYLNIPFFEFSDQTSEISIAYQKGFINSEIELRKEIIENAKMGSPAAQESISKIIINSKTDNSKNG